MYYVYTCTLYDLKFIKKTSKVKPMYNKFPTTQTLQNVTIARKMHHWPTDSI